MDDTHITDRRTNSVLQGRYRVLSMIASGGMGVVYRGERLALGRPVAIKFLHSSIASDPALRRRFETEARAMSRLSHPCCCSVLDFGEEQGVPYLVMEYVSGETLWRLLREQPLPPKRAVAVVRQILAGLAHAHEHGITHRDIKPDNVVVTDANVLGDQVRILDFGIAKLQDAGGSTAIGSLIGTPAYMAPEQITGEAVDPRTDLYSTGVVLFELLTGKNPFDSPQAMEILRLQREAVPPSLSQAHPRGTFSPALQSAVARALEKRPEHRFQNAAEFAAALARTPEHSGLPLAPSTPPKAMAGPSVEAVLQRATAWLLASVRRVRGVALLWPAKRWAQAAGAVLAAGVLSAVLWPASSGAPESLTVASASQSASSTEDLPGLAEAQRLAAAGRRDSALAAFARLRRDYPSNAEVAFLEGELRFQNFRWTEGLDSFAAAIQNDPRYRADQRLAEHLIRCLDSDRFHGQCASFLLTELGQPARLPLEEAAQSHPLRNVRYRAAWLAERLR